MWVWVRNLQNTERNLTCGSMALSFVKYSDTKNWSVGNVLEVTLPYNPRYVLVKLSDLLTREEEKCHLDDDTFYQQVTIRCGGNGLERRRNGFKKGSEIKTRNQSVLRAGQLVFSKIDAKNGAFALVSESYEGSIVTKDFPTYRIDEKRVRSQYLLLLLLSAPFMQVVDRCSKGTTNRRRVDIEMLMGQGVPVPTLMEQDAILKHYNLLMEKLKGRDVAAQEKEFEKEQYIMNTLGLCQNSNDEDAGETSNLTFIEYESIVNWNVNVSVKGSFVESSKYATRMISDLADDILLLKKGYNPHYDEQSPFRVLNQKCVRWGYIDAQFAKGVDITWLNRINGYYATREGDVLINSTGEGTIGRSAVVGIDHSNMQYDSHLILLRVNREKICPRYISILVNSTYGQKQIEDLKSAKTTKQTELGVSNVSRFVIPIPPLAVQEDIARNVCVMNERIAQLKNTDVIKVQARAFFEQQIYE